MGIFLSKEEVVCPESLLRRAAGRAPAVTAIVGAGHEVVLESVRQACEHGLIDPVFIGESSVIRDLADVMRWDISAFPIHHAEGEEQIARRGADLAASGQVQMVMKGHVHSDAFMRPLLDKDSGVRGDSRLSHVFHMTLPKSPKALLLTDCALNVAPNIKTRIAIVENAVALAHRIGIDCPQVAMLAASETVSPAMPVTGECAEIVAHFSDSDLEMQIEGPFAFDNIVSETSARMKGIESSVAGEADIIVVPTIETGNALFKMMVYFMSACAGGIVLGGRVPILLTSRADPPAARLASAALGALSSL
mgnify:FL=1